MKGERKTTEAVVLARQPTRWTRVGHPLAHEPGRTKATTAPGEEPELDVRACESRTSISNASFATHSWRHIRMPLACSIVALDDVARLIDSASRTAL